MTNEDKQKSIVTKKALALKTTVDTMFDDITKKIAKEENAKPIDEARIKRDENWNRLANQNVGIEEENSNTSPAIRKPAYNIHITYSFLT